MAFEVQGVGCLCLIKKLYLIINLDKLKNTSRGVSFLAKNDAEYVP
jgi:hypothetical protein